MLASDEERVELDALRFSLASDIVELVVLTGDEAFLQTLRDAVGGARRLWHVLSPDKVSDLLVAGEVGILVLDVLALHEVPAVFIGQIKRQFPDLVVVVAGNRDSEPALAGLISAGTIYRFIHKPMSPGRAKLFAEAAVKKYEETRKLTATGPSFTRPSRSNRGLMVGAAIGALGIISIISWAIHRNAADNPLPPPAAGYRSAPAAQVQMPEEPSSGTGLAEVNEHLPAQTQNPLIEERLDRARAAIDTARNAAQPKAGARSEVKTGEDRKVPALDVPSSDAPKPPATADTAAAPDAIAAADVDAARASVEAARRQAQIDAGTELLKVANERLQQDRLIEPANDSAKYYLLRLRGVDPNNAGLGAAMRELGSRLAAKARSALALQQYDAARSGLGEAAAIGFSSPEFDATRHDLDSAVAAQAFMTNVIAAGSLTPVKSVQPRYPKKAELDRTEGWVELDFTVAESGAVKDLAVHAASTPGVFEDAAMGALSQWRYKPLVRDGKAVAQRARARIRFTLAD